MDNKRTTALTMIDLQSWKEVSKGYYRFVFAPGACYEIIANFWEEPIKEDNATATLYCTGTWNDPKEFRDVFEREYLFAGTIAECMFAAKKDYEENVTE